MPASLNRFKKSIENIVGRVGGAVVRKSQPSDLSDNNLVNQEFAVTSGSDHLVIPASELTNNTTYAFSTTSAAFGARNPDVELYLYDAVNVVEQQVTYPGTGSFWNGDAPILAEFSVPNDTNDWELRVRDQASASYDLRFADTRLVNTPGTEYNYQNLGILNNRTANITPITSNGVRQVALAFDIEITLGIEQTSNTELDNAEVFSESWFDLVLTSSPVTGVITPSDGVEYQKAQNGLILREMGVLWEADLDFLGDSSEITLTFQKRIGRSAVYNAYNHII